jgi:hypothetical protein
MLAKPAAQWLGPLTTARPIRRDRRCLHDDLGPPAARYAEIGDLECVSSDRDARCHLLDYFAQAHQRC